jgi:hypothetical protein
MNPSSLRIDILAVQRQKGMYIWSGSAQLDDEGSPSTIDYILRGNWSLVVKSIVRALYNSYLNKELMPIYVHNFFCRICHLQVTSTISRSAVNRAVAYTLFFGASNPAGKGITVEQRVINKVLKRSKIALIRWSAPRSRTNRLNIEER